MESYIVQLEFSAALDRVSHSGLLSKLMSIGVGGSVQSICREFLSNRRQRVVVDGATRADHFWHATVKCVGSSSVYLFTSEMFELVENRIYAYIC